MRLTTNSEPDIFVFLLIPSLLSLACYKFAKLHRSWLFGFAFQVLLSNFLRFVYLIANFFSFFRTLTIYLVYIQLTFTKLIQTLFVPFVSVCSDPANAVALSLICQCQLLFSGPTKATELEAFELKPPKVSL